jgi:hypothetical protein
LTLTLFSKRSPLTLTGCLRFIPALINRGLGGCHDGVDLAEISRKSLGCMEFGNDSKAGADLEEAIRTGYLVWGSKTVSKATASIGLVNRTKLGVTKPNHHFSANTEALYGVTALVVD